MVTVELNDETENFDVWSGDQIVGEIVLMEKRHIARVEIEEKHRGAGRGPRALRQAIERLTERLDDGTICVSMPIDDSLEYVLKEEGFQTQFSDRPMLSL